MSLRAGLSFTPLNQSFYGLVLDIDVELIGRRIADAVLGRDDDGRREALAHVGVRIGHSV